LIRYAKGDGAVIEVSQVEIGAEYILLVTFKNGERRHFDMAPYLQYPVFQKLKNPAFFSLARVDYGTVTWPGDIDIAPETLYAFESPDSPS
jgi:hypothetical protein